MAYKILVAPTLIAGAGYNTSATTNNNLVIMIPLHKYGAVITTKPL